jgi:hypothetical protein
MSKTSFAEYSTAFAFQCSLAGLVDMGFNNSVIPLVGTRGADPGVVGRYIRCAKSLRLRSLIILGAGSAIVFPLVMRNQTWPWPVKLCLWVAVIAAVFFSMNDVYRAPLLIHQKLTTIYRTDVIPAVARLVLSYLLHVAGALFGWVAAWFSALNYLQTAFMLRRAAKPYVAEPAQPDPETTHEIVEYLKPLWPGMIYYAFQGSIAVALISYFGKTSSIAETAALGRLGQLFVFLGTALTTLFSPSLARTEGLALIRKVLAALVVLAAFLALLTLLAFVWPAPFLFLLGKQYHNLAYLTGPVVLYASIFLLASLLAITATVKKWVTRRLGWTPALVSFGVQLVYICAVGVSTTVQAVYFQLVSNAATLVLWLTIVSVNLARVHREAAA